MWSVLEFIYGFIGGCWGWTAKEKQKDLYPERSAWYWLALVFTLNCIFWPIAIPMAIWRENLRQLKWFRKG